MKLPDQTRRFFLGGSLVALLAAGDVQLWSPDLGGSPTVSAVTLSRIDIQIEPVSYVNENVVEVFVRSPPAMPWPVRVQEYQGSADGGATWTTLPYGGRLGPRTMILPAGVPAAPQIRALLTDGSTTPALAFPAVTPGAYVAPQVVRTINSLADLLEAVQEFNAGTGGVKDQTAEWRMANADFSGMTKGDWKDIFVGRTARLTIRPLDPAVGFVVPQFAVYASTAADPRKTMGDVTFEHGLVETLPGTLPTDQAVQQTTGVLVDITGANADLSDLRLTCIMGSNAPYGRDNLRQAVRYDGLKVSNAKSNVLIQKCGFEKLFTPFTLYDCPPDSVLVDRPSVDHYVNDGFQIVIDKTDLAGGHVVDPFIINAMGDGG